MHNKESCAKNGKTWKVILKMEKQWSLSYYLYSISASLYSQTTGNAQLEWILYTLGERRRTKINFKAEWTRQEKSRDASEEEGLGMWLNQNLSIRVPREKQWGTWVWVGRHPTSAVWCRHLPKWGIPSLVSLTDGHLAQWFPFFFIPWHTQKITFV